MNLDFSNLNIEGVPWWMPGGVALVFGLLSCFYGNKLLKLVLFLLGFAVGSYSLMFYLPGYVELEWNLLLGLSAIAGVVVGVLLVVLYYAGVFVMGALLGLVLCTPFVEQLEELFAILVMVVVFMLGGFMALKLQTWTMKVATACVGAWHAVQSVLFLTKVSPLLFPWQMVLNREEGVVIGEVAKQPLYFWVICLGLALAGIFYQFGLLRRKQGRE